jgi:galactose oxidase
VKRVTLVRQPSVTHAFDENQRFGPLALARSAGGLRITAPASGAGAPPGHYMLFLLDADGIPSIARIVRLQ